MDLFEKDVANILVYVEEAKKAGRCDCVYNTNKVSGAIYRILSTIKEKLPGHKVWYVDPVLVRTPFEVVEEWGLHIQWANDVTPPRSPVKNTLE
jgi:hypothetical protein